MDVYHTYDGILLLPSKDHIGQSSSFQPKLFSIRVFDLRLCVGLYPSSQMYSNFVFVLMTEAHPYLRGKMKCTRGLLTDRTPRLRPTGFSRLRNSGSRLIVVCRASGVVPFQQTVCHFPPKKYGKHARYGK